MELKLDQALVARIDGFLARGLCSGVGDRDGQMCVEAAICAALDLPHGDDPGCVAAAVRSFKIQLNDSGWSSPKARAKGLRSLAIAQLGSKGVVNDVEFAQRVALRTIRELLPKVLREIVKTHEAIRAAEACERAEDLNAASAASDAASAASDAASAASDAASAAAWAAARAASAASAASAAAWAASAASAAASDAASDGYLIMAAEIALGVLRELKSPGVDLLAGEVAGGAQ